MNASKKAVQIDQEYLTTKYVMSRKTLDKTSAVGKFPPPTWNPLAGEQGAYVSTSSDGALEVVAEPTNGGFNLWLVRTSDGETMGYTEARLARNQIDELLREAKALIPDDVNERCEGWHKRVQEAGL